MTSRTLFAALALLFLTAVSVSAEKIQYCAGQPYYPSQYTCYNGFLCPVVQGERSLKCGSACYLPEAYSCKNGQLEQHGPVKNPFGLLAKNSIAGINGRRVQACGRHFSVGPGASTCTYCPFGGCGSFLNSTLLTGGGGAMDVEVPGGQQTYIEKDGALGFSQAHSASIPTGAVVGYWQAYENGHFQNTRASGWVGCPTGGSGGKKAYQIFAKLDGLEFGADCVTLNIITKEYPRGTYGAFQYT